MCMHKYLYESKKSVDELDKEGKGNQGVLIEPCWSDRNLHPKVKRKS